MSAISGIHGDEDPVHDDRVQSEAPAEGDPEFDESEIRHIPWIQQKVRRRLSHSARGRRHRRPQAQR